MLADVRLIDDSDSDPTIAILAAFLELWETAPEQDREAILQQHCDRDPELAEQFRSLVAGWRLVSDVKDPEHLGPYRVIRVLAIGGMGKVYEAEDEVLSRRVAVKTMRHGRLADPRLLERFVHEREALAMLHHTNIVPIYGAGEEAGLLYFAMPLLEGLTLADLIRASSRISSARASTGSPSTWEEFLSRATTEASRERYCRRVVASLGHAASVVRNAETPPSPARSSSHPAPLGLPRDYRRRVVEVIAVAAEAIDSAHEAGVLHRDLKPSNIQIEPIRGTSEPASHPWVLDFGLAHLGRSKAENDAALRAGPDDPTRQSRTDRPTEGVGTPGYMAPEQVPRVAGGGAECLSAEDRSPIDRYTDVWGLGVTLYELLTLRMPFPGQNVAEVVRKIVSAPPERWSGSIPRELKAICFKALEKDAANRYETAASFAADLRRWLEVRPTLAGESFVRSKAGRLLSWPWILLRRLVYWSRRERATAFAAGLFAALLLVGILGAKAQLDATQRSLEFLRLSQLRRPIRKIDWFKESWQNVRSLRGIRGTTDPQVQSEAAAALEGIDAHVVKKLDGAAEVVEFDPRSECTLMVRAGKDQSGKLWSLTTLWNRSTNQVVERRDLGSGAIAFRPDGTPLQLSRVYEEVAELSRSTKLRLFDVKSGAILREFLSPLDGVSDFSAITLSRSGSHVAAVRVPVRKDGDGFVPDGEVTTITVWDVGHEQPIVALKHKTTRDLILSPDGRLLAAWDIAGEITVWILPDGKELRRFRVGRTPVLCLAFGRDPIWHDDGSAQSWLLAVGESTGLVTVRDLAADQARSVCRGSAHNVRSMAFSADGAMLLTGGRVPNKLWDVATGRCLLDLKVGDFTRAVAFAPDGHHIAVARELPEDATDGATEVLDLDHGHGTHTLYGTRGVVERTTLSPDGRRIVGATHEWEMGIWEWPSGRLIGVLPAPVGRFADNVAMACDADNRRFACSAGHQAQLWDLEKRRLIGRWDLHEGLTECLAFPTHGRLLLVRSETERRQGGPLNPSTRDLFLKVVRVYDLLSPTPTQPFAEINEFNWEICMIRLARNGSVFAVDGVGTDQGKLTRKFHVYEGSTGKLVRTLPTRRGVMDSGWFVFDPSGKMLAASLEESKLNEPMSLFDLPAFTYRGSVDLPIKGLGPGATLSLGTSIEQPREIVLFDIARQLPLLRIVEDTEATESSFEFSPDGRLAMFGRKDGTISVLDLVEINRRLTELRLGW